MKQRGPRDELLPDSHSTIPVSVEAAPPRSVARHTLSLRSARGRRRIGVASGVALAIAAVAFLLLPEQAHLSAPGTMNAGHERLECAGCHRPAPGTIRQQLQADARFVLGKRASLADFGARDVRNDDCLACHERPFDRHPAFRFTEPRFAEVRTTLAPHRCESCHREHSGARVTVQAGYCARCHDQLEMKKDPLDVPHVELVRQGQWLTCLGCHDFHGNHLMEKRTKIGSAIDAGQIQRYFEGGASPYPALLRKPASQTRVQHDD
jgi:hypothetical protein